MDLLCFCSVLCLLYICARLFIYALWSPARKGLTSWLSFVVSSVSLSLSLKHILYINKVNKGAKIRNQYNQVPHLTQDTNGKVTNSQ